jgi:hypothetical protein
MLVPLALALALALTLALALALALAFTLAICVPFLAIAAIVLFIARFTRPTFPVYIPI